MDQTQVKDKSCSVCSQRFETDRELQEHQQSMHAQDGRGPTTGRAGETSSPSKKDERAA